MITVIVPVYNRAYCLRRCLDSIKNQSFKDWECILIDDGSTDDSLAVCREYVVDDKRFKVYHQVNQGVSAARNKGLDMARGAYINFVDSDDYLDEDCLSTLYEKRSNTDWVIGGMQEVCHGKLVRNYSYKDTTVYPDLQYEKEFVAIEHAELFLGPCCKLYKRSILEENQIRFPLSISYGEDTIFNFTYLLHVSSFRVCNKCLYIIEATPGSLSALAIPSFDKMKQIWDAHLLFYVEKGLMGKQIHTCLKTYYCCLLWGLFANTMKINEQDGVFKRYALVKNIFSFSDPSIIKGSSYSFWRRYTMNHPFTVWLFFELKHLLIELHIIH